MDRFNEIENFFTLFKNRYILNPNLEITSDSIYNWLSEYGLTIQEIMHNPLRQPIPKIRNSFFDYWIETFSNNPNLNVFYTERQKRFLQFNNSKRNTPECYKLYLSFPEDKMQECIKIIFQFIANNKIETFSKVADCVRSDSVVLRIAKQNDTKKVIDFINNNQTLTSAAKPVNPFLQKTGVIGMAYDRWMSYNSMLSDMLSRYFREKKKTNTLASASLNDFRNYLQTFTNNIFNNRDALVEFMKDKKVIREFEYYRGIIDEFGVLANIKDILELINLELDPSKTNDDYFKRIELYMSEKHQQSNHESITRLLRTNDKEDVKIAYNAKEIVDDYIRYAIKKYGSVDNAARYLLNYLNANDICGITRDIVPPYKEGFRFLFQKYVSRNKLYTIVNGDAINYMNSLAQKKDNSIDTLKLFRDACKATIRKYGYMQLISALYNGINGDYSSFTNDGDKMLRENMMKYIDQNTFKKYAAAMLAELFNNEQNQNNQKNR